jgi:isopentenyl phosphate kinase
VFHCPQAGHFPIHFGDSWPQLEHTYAILSFAILIAKLRLFLEFAKKCRTFAHDYEEIIDRNGGRAADCGLRTVV